ncbi:hypothetical protein BGZ73_008338 [Actinomortierella ambigua]|nr:hypothetical protein BGZ73_008338 [Actinomortierella ambigua]
MTVDDQSMQTLWKLTNDLTTQLVFNRNATLELKQQLADLKAKVASGSFTLSDDASTSHRPSGQQHVEESLRIANERLAEENIQLQDQMREYERWIEYIMTKFRLQNFAMVHSRKEVMQEAYKIIEQERELNNQLRAENAALQQRLVQVGSIARRAINDEYYKTETLVDMLMVENQGLREMLGVAEANGNIEHNAMEGRQPGYRVSFPSTGSYNGSSEGDEMEVGGSRLGSGIADGGSGETDTAADEQLTDTSTTLTSADTATITRILSDSASLSQPPTPLHTIPQESSKEVEEDGGPSVGDEPGLHDPESNVSHPEHDLTAAEDIPSYSDHTDDQALSPSHSNGKAVTSTSNGLDQRQKGGNSNLDVSDSDDQRHNSEAVAHSKLPLLPSSPPPPLLSSPSASAAVSPVSINTDVSGVVTVPKRTTKPRKKRTK